MKIAENFIKYKKQREGSLGARDRMILMTNLLAEAMDKDTK